VFIRFITFLAPSRIVGTSVHPSVVFITRPGGTFFYFSSSFLLSRLFVLCSSAISSCPSQLCRSFDKIIFWPPYDLAAEFLRLGGVWPLTPRLGDFCRCYSYLITALVLLDPLRRHHQSFVFPLLHDIPLLLVGFAPLPAIGCFRLPLCCRAYLLCTV